MFINLWENALFIMAIVGWKMDKIISSYTARITGINNDLGVAETTVVVQVNRNYLIILVFDSVI